MYDKQLFLASDVSDPGKPAVPVVHRHDRSFDDVKVMTRSAVGKWTLTSGR